VTVVGRPTTGVGVKTLGRDVLSTRRHVMDHKEDEANGQLFCLETVL